MKNIQIFSLLKKVSVISEPREILFFDIENLITDKDIYKRLKKNSEKVFLYKFLYKVDDCKVVGFISIPKSIDINKKHKTIVALRGGSRDFGAIKLGYFYNLQSHFSWFSLDENYITISTQYRGNSGSTGVDEFGGKDLNDVKILYEIIRELSFCDSEKIGAFGWSRGAQMIYQLLQTEDWIKTAVCVAGPTNHIRTIEENLRPEWKQHLVNMFGGEEDKIKERSAMYWPEKIKNIPILLIHGNKDDKVDVRDSVDLNSKLQNSYLEIIEDGDHNLMLHREKIKDLTLKWFNQKL